MLNTGQRAPDFTAKDANGNTHTLEGYQGQKVILYFYPKDDTPGCTKQACNFRDNLPDFKGLNVTILGVSRDDEASHAKFSKKFDLNFPLLADTTGQITESYGVWVEKSMYGKKYMGIERTTFLLDEQGVIQHIWRKVNVDNHVSDIQNVLKELAAAA
jgi:thioredoxin-dependent peroxiredoxin